MKGYIHSEGVYTVKMVQNEHFPQMQFWIITINQLPTETISHWYRDALMAAPNTNIFY